MHATMGGGRSPGDMYFHKYVSSSRELRRINGICCTESTKQLHNRAEEAYCSIRRNRRRRRCSTAEIFLPCNRAAAAARKAKIFALRIILLLIYVMICSCLCLVEATTLASTSDNTHNPEGEDISKNVEYRVDTFFDHIEDEDCIDLDYVVEDELAQQITDENSRDKKKQDVLQTIESLNIDMGALGSTEKGSRLKRRPEPPDIVDISDTQQPARTRPAQIEENTEKHVNSDSDSVLIVSAIDGTLAGISRSSGQIIWKQSQDSHDAPDVDTSTSSAGLTDSWNKFLSPLVSTTTKSTSTAPGHHNSQWHAVPSIDGTVYLTAAPENDLGGPASQELSITTHICELVDRAPFVDAHGRFFVGSRRAMVAAIDEQTGEILRIIPKWKVKQNDEEGDEEILPPSLEGRNVVWIGRLEHAVTVHDLQKGTVDIEFSVAQILSVDEMIRGDQHSLSSLVVGGDSKNNDMGSTEGSNFDEDDMERIFTKYIAEALRHPNDGDRLLSLPAPNDFDEEDPTINNVDTRGSSFLVTTPDGNVAFRDDSSSSFGWVSFKLLSSPVVYAIEASTGQKIKVNIIGDAVTSSESNQSSNNNMPGDNLSELLQMQITYLSRQMLAAPDAEIDDECSNGNAGECRALAVREQSGSLVGALKDGQLYALPLGSQSSRRQYPLGLPLPHSKASSLSHAQEIHRAGLNTNHAIGFHGQSTGVDMDSGDMQRIHIDSSKQACTPTSPLYPGCLIGASLMMGNIILDRDEIASVFEASDLDFDLYLDMLEENQNRKKNRFVQIMSSWIAPVVALLFVVSFEIGRRERLKADKVSAEASEKQPEESNGTGSSIANSTGIIQLTDEILGYGGHGTIVYKGVLDKRQVAVKRLLSMYHTSADREISLLIESDGHPNVVRYFLKETRGDFVYLALELCDMSLDDLIVSLSKLKNTRKENLQLAPDTEDVESATKSLLFQIASGVRHIHSLRIVHRDLKPQNILLAQRTRLKSVTEDGDEGSDSEVDVDDSQTQTTCSDTNEVLHMFMSDGYVPKISDMGLGKQLAGQSSFGLSTLGTGSIGGPGCNPSIAGAGAGSVGWQAPEVMAMRFSNETSSYDGNESMSEASPYEANISARTSRSVDIFSLGCIFYCTVLPGSHPFGEWYEREANIMKNKPNKEDLEFVSPEASDLILSMIHRNAKYRPTAEEVCEHPFFWSPSKRLKFLCDLSDRIELCSTSPETAGHHFNIFAIEKGAFEVFGTSWEKQVDQGLIIASLNRRTYDPASVRDCLRMIRNKHHHWDELPSDLKSRVGTNTDGFSLYISRRFPRLVIHCYNYCIAHMGLDDPLALDYKFSIPRLKNISHQSSSIIEMPEPLISLEPISDDYDKDIATANKSDSFISDASLVDETEIQPAPQDVPQVEGHERQDRGDVSGVVLWAGSNAAKQFSCRGWIRSEDEWVQRIDAKLRKRDANIARCAEDPKFRTRLCNEWDTSQGTFCSMKRRNKCIFAHGPVELRVKEGKKRRWGTLVNKQGECANPKASGGEDTYTAAKNIEDMRKEKGEWNPGKPNKWQQRPGSAKSNKSKESTKNRYTSKQHA